MKKYFFLIAIVCCLLSVIILIILSQANYKQQSPNSALKNDNSSVANGSSAESVQPSNDMEGILVGTIAPDFSFTTIDGKTIQLSSLQGQPVIFSFALTTGCEPCVIEAENIREAQKQVSLKVIQLAINPQDTTNDLKTFRDTYGSPDWLIGYDKDIKIANAYQVRSPDTTIVIDANGKIIYRDDGVPIETKTLVDLLK